MCYALGDFISFTLISTCEAMTEAIPTAVYAVVCKETFSRFLRRDRNHVNKEEDISLRMFSFRMLPPRSVIKDSASKMC